MKRIDVPTLQISVALTLSWAGLFYVFLALVLRWEDAFGWSRQAVMGAFTASILAQAIAAPFIGSLLDRGHARAVMTTGAAVGGVLLMAVGWVTTLTGLYAVWIAIGFASAACLYDPAFTVVTRGKGAGAHRVITFITLVGGFAGTIAYPMIYFISENWGWEKAAMVFGLAILTIAAPLIYLSVPALDGKTIEPKMDRADTKPKGFLGKPIFWALALTYAALSLGIGAELSHALPVFAENKITDRDAAFAVACIGPLQVTGRLILMGLGGRMSSIFLMFMSFALVAIAAIALLFSGNALLFIIVFVLFYGVGNGMQTILRPLVLREVFGETAFGAISGATASARLIAFALAPTFGALVWAFGGYVLLLPLIAVICLVAGAVFVVATLRARKVSAAT